MGFFRELKKYLKSEWYNLINYHKIKLITLILALVFFPVTIALAPIGFLFGIFISILPGKKEYDNSIYKLITNKSYMSIIFDKGYCAEYLTWKILHNQPEYKEVLINLYIPNQNDTSEIDSILINKYGIFVIESKGYSGWIFGNEEQKMWTQTIYKNKYKFYNPITQNRNHILALAKFLGITDMNVFRSYIVFSERCELKKININKSNVKVIKRHELQNTLDNDYEKYGTVLLDSQIKKYNEQLVNYMFPCDDVKIKHIEYVKQFKTKSRDKNN